MTVDTSQFKVLGSDIQGTNYEMLLRSDYEPRLPMSQTLFFVPEAPPSQSLPILEALARGHIPISGMPPAMRSVSAVARATTGSATHGRAGWGGRPPPAAPLGLEGSGERSEPRSQARAPRRFTAAPFESQSEAGAHK